jgi:hypothetical protein
VLVEVAVVAGVPVPVHDVAALRRAVGMRVLVGGVVLRGHVSSLVG